MADVKHIDGPTRPNYTNKKKLLGRSCSAGLVNTCAYLILLIWMTTEGKVQFVIAACFEIFPIL